MVLGGDSVDSADLVGVESLELHVLLQLCRYPKSLLVVSTSQVPVVQHVFAILRPNRF